ncbi:MAG TPA: hypothetical protein PLH23_01830 [Hyphomonadaceae bacterium]|nr:hypothetical protein [Hyphomonadaceae bacterium]HPI46976.1 hypothetical protein [Hyphomonadaceae bacterium]
MEWVAISIVVGIGIVLYATVQIVKMGIAHEDKRLALKAGVGDAGRIEQILAANQAEMAKLRERVQVLERLATDDDRKLAGDIERLRAADTMRG